MGGSVRVDDGGPTQTPTVAPTRSIQYCSFTVLQIASKVEPEAAGPKASVASEIVYCFTA